MHTAKYQNQLCIKENESVIIDSIDCRQQQNCDVYILFDKEDFCY